MRKAACLLATSIFLGGCESIAQTDGQEATTSIRQAREINSANDNEEKFGGTRGDNHSSKNDQSHQGEPHQPAKNPDTQKEESTIEALRGSFAEGVAESARWMDNFFADPDFPTTDVDTRLILRQDFIKQESMPHEIKTRLNARVRLPNISRKLSLSLSEDDEDEDELDQNLPQTRLSEADDRPNLGLEFLNERNPGSNERVKLGYRFSESSYYIGSRIRRSVEFAEQWQARASQRIRYYKQFGWESETIVELDFLKRNDYLLRQRIKALWRDDIRLIEGTQTNFTTSFIHQLSDHSAWRIVSSSDYYTKPNKRWVSSRLAFGYRRTIGYPWIRVELQPFVEWQEVNAWHPEYGFALLFNILIEE